MAWVVTQVKLIDSVDGFVVGFRSAGSKSDDHNCYDGDNRNEFNPSHIERYRVSNKSHLDPIDKQPNRPLARPGFYGMASITVLTTRRY